jgi:MerR family transcriptional regulator, light-induced transcriptional regulator
MAKRSPAPARSYPIRAVARLTGLSIDTLRAWERRYAAVVPERGERGRVYSDADIARLKQLAALVERGHAIGSVASLSAAQLSRLLDQSGNGSHAPADRPVADLAPIMAALDGYDLDAIEAVLARHAAVLPPRDLVFAVMLPLLRELGQRWESGLLSPAQEHVVSAIVRSVLGNLLRAIGRSDGTSKIVFATPSGERHELALLCAAILAASAGYGVIYLGPDLPAADIGHAVRTSGARVAVLGATTPGAVTRAEAENLATSLADADLWIGGPQAVPLLANVGAGAHVERLEDLVPMLNGFSR